MGEEPAIYSFIIQGASPLLLSLIRLFIIHGLGPETAQADKGQNIDIFSIILAALPSTNKTVHASIHSFLYLNRYFIITSCRTNTGLATGSTAMSKRARSFVRRASHICSGVKGDHMLGINPLGRYVG